MSGPGSGKYLIVPANVWGPPPRPVGANHEGAFAHVVVGGRDRVWIAHKLENGNYHLSLELPRGPLPSRGLGEDVVVEVTSDPGVWTIDKKPDGLYSIAVPTVNWPTKGWTVDNSVPGTKVRLETYGPGAEPGQLWNFIHIDE